MFKSTTEIVSQFADDKMPRWPRVVFPAAAILAILWKEGWVDSLASFTTLLPISLLAGGIVYYIYFVTLHKLIRFVTYHLFGLETYDLTTATLKAEHLLSEAISPFKLQALVGAFFAEHPKARKAETVLMSSIFHGLYMTAIIWFAYFTISFALNPGLAASISALVCFVGMLFVMWCDSTFGENAECLAIRRSMPQFVLHLRAHFEPLTQIRASDAPNI